MTALIVLGVACIIAYFFEEEIKNVEDEEKRNTLYVLGKGIARLIIQIFR